MQDEIDRYSQTRTNAEAAKKVGQLQQDHERRIKEIHRQHDWNQPALVAALKAEDERYEAARAKLAADSGGKLGVGKQPDMPYAPQGPNASFSRGARRVTAALDRLGDRHDELAQRIALELRRCGLSGSDEGLIRPAVASLLAGWKKGRPMVPVDDQAVTDQVLASLRSGPQWREEADDANSGDTGNEDGASTIQADPTAPSQRHHLADPATIANSPAARAAVARASARRKRQAVSASRAPRPACDPVRITRSGVPVHASLTVKPLSRKEPAECPPC